MGCQGTEGERLDEENIDMTDKREERESEMDGGEVQHTQGAQKMRNAGIKI